MEDENDERNEEWYWREIIEEENEMINENEKKMKKNEMKKESGEGEERDENVNKEKK